MTFWRWHAQASNWRQRATAGTERPVGLSHADQSRTHVVTPQPGKVMVPVLIPGDVTHVVADKSDLLGLLGMLDPNASVPWAFYGTLNGNRKLDIQP